MATVKFLGVRESDPDEPWTIVLQPALAPPSSESTESGLSEEDEERRAYLRRRRPRTRPKHLDA